MRPPARNSAILCAVAALLAAPAGSTGPASVSANLAARMLATTPVASDLEALCDRIGGRPTGSSACERSIDWFVARFDEVKVDRVWTEEFKMPGRWQEGRSSAEILSPEKIPLRVVAMPFSPPTPKKGLEAPVVVVGDAGPAGSAAVDPSLRGAFWLIESPVLASWDDLFLDYSRLPPLMDRARAAGAAGLLLIGGRPHDLLYRHVATMGDVAPYPMAILAREDGLRLARMARHGARLRLTLDVTTGPSFESRNVLAEIRGSERPDEIVLAGAHLDSWDLGTGALDNGANCAMILDVARQMAAAGVRPRRTVRFALFTGEEEGMYGSLGYVRRHRGEMNRHAAAIIFDSGTGRITGFSTGGRDDLSDVLDPSLAAVAGYEARHHTNDAYVGTDNLDFLLEGVPNLVANQETANYLDNYHASSDTFDKVDLREMKINGAIAAAAIFGIADASLRATRQDRAAIASVLERTGLTSQMKLFGLWNAWEKRERGRAD